MPEYGSIKKKPKKEDPKGKPKSSEVVSAYSEEGKRREEYQKKMNRLTLIALLASFGLAMLVLLIFAIAVNAV